MKTHIVVGNDIKEHTIGEAMEVISERDLTFIATYNPQAFKSMCLMWSLEKQLQKEGYHPSSKNIALETRKPKNLFVYSWYKLKSWLFSKLLKMVSPKQ